MRPLGDLTSPRGQSAIDTWVDMCESPFTTLEGEHTEGKFYGPRSDAAGRFLTRSRGLQPPREAFCPSEY